MHLFKFKCKKNFNSGGGFPRGGGTGGSFNGGSANGKTGAE